MDGKVGPYKTLAYVAGIHTSIRCIIVNLNTGTHVILRMSWEIAGDPTILYLVIPLVHILFFLLLFSSILAKQINHAHLHD